MSVTRTSTNAVYLPSQQGKSWWMEQLKRHMIEAGYEAIELDRAVFFRKKPDPTTESGQDKGREE